MTPRPRYLISLVGVFTERSSIMRLVPGWSRLFDPNVEAAATPTAR